MAKLREYATYGGHEQNHKMLKEGHSPLERVRAQLSRAHLVANTFLYHWYTRDLQAVEAAVLSPTTSRMVFSFPVTKEYLNLSGTLHGGAIATFFDVCTSMVFFLVSKPGFWSRYGVTRTLSCTYLRPAVLGEVLLLEAEIVHAGKSLALVNGVLKREEDGAVIATCEHNKVNIDPPVEAKL